MGDSIVLADDGHAANIEQPKAFNEALLGSRTSPSSGLGWHGTVARGGHEPRIESISWLVRRAVGPVLGQVPTPRNSSRIVATSGPWTCSGSATANTSVAWAVTSRIGVGAKLAKDRIPPRDHHDQRKGVSCLSRLRIT